MSRVDPEREERSQSRKEGIRKYLLVPLGQSLVVTGIGAAWGIMRRKKNLASSALGVSFATSYLYFFYVAMFKSFREKDDLWNVCLAAGSSSASTIAIFNTPINYYPYFLAGALSSGIFFHFGEKAVLAAMYSPQHFKETLSSYLSGTFPSFSFFSKEERDKFNEVRKRARLLSKELEYLTMEKTFIELRLKELE